MQGRSDFVPDTVSVQTLARALVVEAAYGGGTLMKDGEDAALTKGFVVGGYLPELIVPYERRTVLFDTLEAWLMKARYAGSKYSFTYYGVWRDASMLYFDGCQHFDTVAYALQMGRFNSQRAVWDCKNNREIWCR